MALKTIYRRNSQTGAVESMAVNDFDLAYWTSPSGGGWSATIPSVQQATSQNQAPAPSAPAQSGQQSTSPSSGATSGGNTFATATDLYNSPVFQQAQAGTLFKTQTGQYFYKTRANGMISVGNPAQLADLARQGIVIPGSDVSVTVGNAAPSAPTNTNTGAPTSGQSTPPSGATPPAPTSGGQADQQGLLSSGNIALVKFTSDPTDDGIDNTSTVWLYDNSNKTYRPIMSWQALQAILPGMADSDIQSFINTVPPGAAQGQFLSQDYGVQNNGYWKPYSAGAGTGANYGKNQDASLEAQIGGLIKTTMNRLLSSKSISQQTYDRYVADPNSTWMKRAVSAAAYGNYTLGDVYRDLKGHELFDGGNQAYAGFSGFSDSASAEDWYGTAEGQKAISNAATVPPISAGVSSSLFNLPIFQIPDAAFKTLVPPVDVTSPDFQKEADQIQAAWFDVMSQQATATTAQAKAVADDNYRILQENLKKKYNIDLSNNARAAWKQVQDLTTQFSSRNILDSGLYQEAQDRYLADVRRADALNREGNMQSSEIERRDYLLKTGTPEQIRQAIEEMNAEDAAKGIPATEYRSARWGLIPDADTKSFYDIANLKKQYPTLSDADIQTMHDMMIDQFGNYRSGLYQNLFSNRYNLSQQKKDYQQEKLLQQKLVEEKKTYAPYTEGNPLSSYQPNGTAASSGTGAAASAAGNISANLSGNSTPQQSSSATPMPIINNNQLTNSAGQKVNQSSIPAGWTLDPTTGRLTKL